MNSKSIKNHRYAGFFALALAASLFAGTALAIDASFTYQGVLRNADGNKITGDKNREIAFRLYDSPDSSTVLWARTVNVLLNDDGLFNVELSDSNSKISASNGGYEGSYQNLSKLFKETASGQLYIGLTVSGSSGEIHPRQKILAVPFAAVAGDVSNASSTLVVNDRLTVSNNGIDVKGESTFKNKLSVINGNGVDVAGASTFRNKVTVTGGGVDVTGESTFKSPVSVTGGGISVSGSSTFGNKVTVSTGGLEVSGDASFHNTTKVMNNLIVYNGGGFEVKAYADSNPPTVFKVTNAGATSISGATTMSGDLTVGTSSNKKTVNINGTLKVNGHPFPVPGMVMLWYGDANNPPAGWRICDGNNGNKVNNIAIPDLRGRFAAGAYPPGSANVQGYSFVYGKTGGDYKVTLTENQIPKHYHTYYGDNVISKVSGTAVSSDFGFNNEDGSGSHGKQYWSGGTGGGEAHWNVPPYFAMHYIIYVGI